MPYPSVGELSYPKQKLSDKEKEKYDRFMKTKKRKRFDKKSVKSIKKGDEVYLRNGLKKKVIKTDRWYIHFEDKPLVSPRSYIPQKG